MKLSELSMDAMLTVGHRDDGNIADPNKLGFPVIVTGTRVRIPKYGFIHFCKYGRNLTILDNNRSNNCGTNCYMPTTDAGSGAYVWAG